MEISFQGLLLLGGIAAPIIYYVLTAVVTWYRLREFKGPILASFSWLWLARTDFSGQAWKTHMRIREKYQSPLIRIGPNLLITDDPDILRRMSSARSRYGRGGWYEALRLDARNPSMFGSCDTAWHDDIKARTSFGYSGREIPTLETNVDEQIGNLKRYIRTRYLSTTETTKPMDFAAAAQYFALDTISKVAFGKEFGFLEADTDVNGYVQAIDVFAPMATLCADIPWIRKLIMSEWMLTLAGPKHTDPKGPGRIMGLSKEAVDQRFEPDAKDQQDMLGSFLRHGLTRHQCEAEGTLQISAGSDTTSNLIRSTMLYLVSSPAAYRRLQQEIDDAVASGKASYPVAFAETKEMPYLQAVVYESMRIHPPNLILANKRVPPEGDTLDGRFVPGGTDIAQNSWSLLRNKKIFGEDSDVFRPERWLGLDAAKRTDMERVAELLFGYGRWMCAGKHIAFMELHKIFFELFREFDFQLLNAKNPWNEIHYNIFLIKNMPMRVTERVKSV